MTTPLTNNGALVMRVGGFLGANFLHVEDVNAVLFAANAEGEELRARECRVVGVVSGHLVLGDNDCYAY